MYLIFWWAFEDFPWFRVLAQGVVQRAVRLYS